ncbi:MAG: endonuclease/exonuclease/phosphatase family protein [Leeuwenhoekiella sp.]
MKSLNFFEKILFFLNSIVALALLFGYILPHIPPAFYPPLSVLTLFMPVVVVVNIVFAIYWMIRLKKQFLLSSIILGLMVFQNFVLYKFFDSDKEPSNNTLTVLSYNVKQFGIVHYSHKDSIIIEIQNFLDKEDADVVCMQEYSNHHYGKHITYPYYYQGLDKKGNTLQNILSKYPIVNQGSLDFKSTWNNGIYVDILKDKDTIRIYNLHMQSLAITPDVGEIKEVDKKQLINRIGVAFTKQADQAKVFLEHRKTSPYKTIVAGDFNNTIFSYTYNQVRGDMIDTFAEAGEGYGRTYMFDFIPLRIDFILTDPDFETIDFEKYLVGYSDHFPIKATLAIP